MALSVSLEVDEKVQLIALLEGTSVQLVGAEKLLAILKKIKAA